MISAGKTGQAHNYLLHGQGCLVGVGDRLFTLFHFLQIVQFALQFFAFLLHDFEFAGGLHFFIHAHGFRLLYHFVFCFLETYTDVDAFEFYFEGIVVFLPELGHLVRGHELAADVGALAEAHQHEERHVDGRENPGFVLEVERGEEDLEVGPGGAGFHEVGEVSIDTVEEDEHGNECPDEHLEAAEVEAFIAANEVGKGALRFEHEGALATAQVGVGGNSLHGDVASIAEAEQPDGFFREHEAVGIEALVVPQREHDRQLVADDGDGPHGGLQAREAVAAGVAHEEIGEGPFRCQHQADEPEECDNECEGDDDEEEWIHDLLKVSLQESECIFIEETLDQCG